MKYFTALLIAMMLSNSLPASAEVVRDIVFPVQGGGTFSDDFQDARSGHLHEGNDIMALKMTPELAAVDGYIERFTENEPSYGWSLSIRDSEGYTYVYIHINNDTPGTDDGLGGIANAFAPGIARGVHVTRGQVVAYVGDSGNAENAGSHLHFEIRLPDRTAVDPYPSLVLAYAGSSYGVSAQKTASPNINTDLGIVASGSGAACVSGSRIRSASSSTVYYCGADGKRYVFPNEKTYFTWYADFTGVVKLTDDQMAGLPIGGNVTYRPGMKLLKIQTSPQVYAVAHGGVLRPVPNSTIATQLYGAAWAKQVDDISEAFFTNYEIGAPIVSVQ